MWGVAAAMTAYYGLGYLMDQAGLPESMWAVALGLQVSYHHLEASQEYEAWIADPAHSTWRWPRCYTRSCDERCARIRISYLCEDIVISRIAAILLMNLEGWACRL